MEAGLPEMAGRNDFYLRVAGDILQDGLMTANLSGTISADSLMDRLTSDLGREFVRFVAPGV